VCSAVSLRLLSLVSWLVNYVCQSAKLPRTVRLPILADRTAREYARLLASSCGPSIRPSVCDAVHCGSQDEFTGLKLYKCVLSKQVPICSFRHFCCRMYLWAAKRTGKNESKKTRTCILETDNQACTGRVTFCYSLTS